MHIIWWLLINGGNRRRDVDTIYVNQNDVDTIYILFGHAIVL